MLGPRQNFSIQTLNIRYSSIKTLPGKHTKLNLCHIEPTTMFWRVMEFEPFYQSAWLLQQEMFHKMKLGNAYLDYPLQQQFSLLQGNLRLIILSWLQPNLHDNDDLLL